MRTQESLRGSIGTSSEQPPWPQKTTVYAAFAVVFLLAIGNWALLNFVVVPQMIVDASRLGALGAMQRARIVETPGDAPQNPTGLPPSSTLAEIMAKPPPKDSPATEVIDLDAYALASAPTGSSAPSGATASPSVAANRSGRGHGVSVVLFQPSSSELSEGALTAVARVAQTVAQNSSVRVQVLGHTDLRSTERSNTPLGRARAEAVRDALVARGVEQGRIEVSSFGSERPIDRGTAPDAQSKNRRVEILWR